MLPGPDEALDAARVVDVTGHVVAPGFIDLHSHGGPGDPRRPAPRAQGPPGRHDRAHRRGRQRVCAVPGAHRTSRDFVVLNGGLDGRPDIAFDWATVAQQLDRYDGTVSVNVATVVGNSPLRIAALGWDDVVGGRGRGRRPAGAAPRGHGGRGVRAVDRARLPARRLRHDRGARVDRGGRRRTSAGSTTRTSATRWATGSWTRSGRRSRSGGGAGHLSTSRTSTTAPRSRARPSRCSRSSMRPSRRASTSRSTSIRRSGRARGS